MRRSSVTCGAAGHDHSVQPVGAQSILSAMDRFVKSVNNMNSTLLVPSKLRDMELPSPSTSSSTSSSSSNGQSNSSKSLSRIPPALANADLYSFYEMLNEVKKELLWGSGVGVTTAATLARLSQTSGLGTTREIKHVRQPSDDSLRSLSLGSTASSDSEVDSELDSFSVTDRESDRAESEMQTTHLAEAFRFHLQSLHTILHRLSDAADYLTTRYQEDIEKMTSL